MPSLVRLLKAIIWGFVTFIALCFAFASIPEPPAIESTIASNLVGGLPVMRVYKFDEFYPHVTFPSEFRRNFETTFAIQWSFSAITNTLHINQQHDILLESGSGQQPAGYVSSVDAKVITNVLDGVMLPWFNMADATLLNNEITPHVAALSLQLIRRPAPPTTTVYDIVGAPTNAFSHLRPLLTITYNSTSASPSIPRFDFPQEPYSMSPSTTFPIRRTILSVLVPVAFVVMFAFIAAFALIKALLAMAMLVAICVLLFGPLKGWRIGGMDILSRGESQTAKDIEVKESGENDAEVAKTNPATVDDMV